MAAVEDKEEVSSDDNEMVEVKVLMALAADNDAISKEGARNGEWVKISMRKCIIEQIPSQKKRILEVDQLTEDPSSSRQKDLVFVKSLTDDTKVSIPSVERPWLSEAEGFILPNHDTGRILLVESQRNTIDPLVAVTDSSGTDYDSTDESSVCSTPLPPLKKLDGAEPVSGPKTIRSILKSKSTFKDETLKGVIINEPFAAPAKGNKSSSASKYDIRKPIWYLDSGCSRHMTGVKSYLHKYVEQSGPKVVFRDDSTCTTEGYGSIKCNGIVFTKVAFVNGLKYNLISISQLCDAKYIVQFDEKRGTIFNSNKDVVMIAPRDKPYSLCEKGKHHRASFKTKQTFSIKKCLHLLQLDLFGPVTPRSINHEKYTLVIVDEYSRTFIEAARTMLSGSVFSKQYWTKAIATACYTQNRSTIVKRHLKNLYEIFLDNINIAKTERYPLDEYLHPYEPSQRYQTNSNDVSFIEPYEYPEPVALETEVSSDQNNQTDHNDQNDQSVQNEEILNDDHSEHSNHTNDEQIIDNLPNTKDIQISKHLSSPSVEDTSVQNTTPIPTPPYPFHQWSP
ncbi:hypothetical protein Tco_0598194 [Tanacetum coccineum]